MQISDLSQEEKERIKRRLLRKPQILDCERVKVMIKKIIKILLAAISVILLLTSCGYQEEITESTNQNEQNQPEQKTDSSWQDSRIALNKCFTGVVIKNDLLYGYGVENGSAIIVIYDLLSGGILQEIELLDAAAVQSIAVDGQGNIYVLGTAVEGSEFWKITGEGEIRLLGQLELEDVDEAINITPKGICVDAADHIYLWYEMGVPANIFYEDELPDVYSMADRIYVIDNDLKTLYYGQVPDSKGTQLKDFYLDEKGNPILLIKDTEGLYLQGLREDDPILRVDSDMDFLRMDYEVFSLKEEGFIFRSGSTLYQYSFSGRECKKILELTAYGIFPEDILYLDLRDEAVEIVDNYRKGGYSEYTQLKMGENEKCILRLGALQISDKLEQIVTEFNRFQNDIRIEVVDYYEEDRLEGGLEQLKLDIVKGTAPDILDVSRIDYPFLAAKGALADLYEYMEQDEACSRNMLMENVLRAYEVNGKLLGIAPAFQLYSMWGKNSITGGRCGVTVQEMRELLETQGKDINAIWGFSADEPVLTTLCTLEMDQFVDWEKGTCDFEGESFAAVLEFAAEYAGYATDDFLTDVRKENIVLSVGVIDSVAKLQLEKEIYGGDINFIGYPTVKGTGTAVGFRGSELAINAGSEKKDEAWRFVRYYLLNGYKGNGLPICKEQFEEAMSTSMEKEYAINGEDQYEIPKLTWGSGGNYIEIYAADLETVSAIKELAAGAEYKFQYHTAIQAIINEEAESYFAGQKTTKEVAAVIQNRVSLYLQEQLN